MIKLSNDHHDGPTTPPLTPLSPICTSVHVHTLTDEAGPLITQYQVSGIRLHNGELTILFLK